MEKVVISKVELNVSNLEMMSEFYQDVIGLKVHSSNDKVVSLGSDRVLIDLVKSDSAHRIDSLGLYHLALLVPSEKDLGETLIHLLKIGANLSGGADHGYSQALYLNDPEGNGIEIYADRPRNEWIIHEDGEIEGYTEELDVNSLLKDTKQEFNGIMDGTIMGHVHLKVKDLNETQQFYEDLGFSLKSDFGNQAKFFAIGMYHHHIGTNTWHGNHLPKLSENQLGLRKIHLNLEHKEKEPQQFEVLDPNGIPLRINFV